MISTRGRYALRVMLDLAEQSTEKFIPLEEIAERQEISKKYLEAILRTLVQNKLLEVLRGRGGGYRLTKKPADYTVGEILKLTEGSLVEIPCLENDSCKRKSFCKTFPIWKKFDKMTNDFFSGITLKDML